MKIRVAAIIFAVAFLSQGTIMNIFSFFGVTPNLMLCLLIVFAFLYENEHAVYLAMAFGLISDICFSNILGISSLGYFLVGLLIIVFRNILNKENIISTFILGTAGTVVFNLFYWIISNTFTDEIGFVNFLKMQPLYILYNLIVMMLIYLALINRVVKNRNDRYYK